MRAMRSLLGYALLIHYVSGSSHANDCDSVDGSCVDSGSALLATQARVQRELHQISEQRETQFPPEANPQLILTIVSASDLAAGSFTYIDGSKNQPYAVCKIGSWTVTTSTSEEPHNPVWNHVADVYAHKLDAGVGTVECEIKCKDAATLTAFGGSDSLGTASVDISALLNDLKHTDGLDQTVQLAPQGQLHLKISAAPILMYLDGETATAFPRKEIQTPEMMFASVPLDRAHGVHVQNGYVTIDHGASMQGLYRRETMSADAQWVNESGVINWKWGFNPVSFFDGSKFGLAEKTIAIQQEGEGVSTISKDLNDKIMQQRGARGDHAAKAAADTRHKLVSLEMLQGKKLAMMIRSGIDPVQVGIVLQALKSGSFPFFSPQDVGTRLAADLDARRDDMKSTVKAAEESDSEFALSTGNSCWHFLGTDEQLSEHGFTMPLDTPLVGFRGVTQFAPLGKMAASPVVFTIVKKDNTLEFSVVAISKVIMEDPRFGVKPVYYQGLPHVSSLYGDKDFRPQADVKDPAHAALYKLMKRFQADYEYLWSGEDCDEGSVRTELEAMNWGMALTHAQADPSPQKILRLVNLVVNALGCARSYLKSTTDKSHAYGEYEAGVWMHMLMEIPPDVIWETINHAWNNVDILKTDSAQ